MVFSQLRSSRWLAGQVLAAAWFAAPAHAQAPYLVVDASSGQVLMQDEATRPWHPASTTKMMTAYVALRAVQAGRAQLDSPLLASARAASQKPSKIGIRAGQEITLDNALKILMVKSANDLAVVIAEGIGGSVEGFSQMMNAEARRLGMTESRFVNPHGWHAPGHVTSARDLALLARAMLTDFPEHRELWGIGAVQLGNRVLNNTNGLIGRYPGAMGMKTGFVCASGFNLVAAANRGGRTLIVVVLGASSGGDRTVRAAQLLEQGFGSWGGQGGTLETMASSGYDSAPDMRSQICTGRRRGTVLADDADLGGAIASAAAGTGDSMAAAGSPLAFFSLPAAQPSQGYSIGRAAGTRFALGPRMITNAMPVYFGRAPGSTAVALGPRGGPSPQETTAARIPASATALAPVPSRAAVPGIEPREERPAAQAGIRARAGAPAADAPMQLNGVVPARAGAQAAIRPRAPAAAPPKQDARAKPGEQRAQAGKDQPTAPKAQARAAPAKATPKAPPNRKKADDE